MMTSNSVEDRENTEDRDFLKAPLNLNVAYQAPLRPIRRVLLQTSGTTILATTAWMS